MIVFFILYKGFPYAIFEINFSLGFKKKNPFNGTMNYVKREIVKLKFKFCFVINRPDLKLENESFPAFI